MGHQTFLILLNYWLNYFEVTEIHTKTVHAVITQFKVQFARHGIPEVIITGNGPEFANEALAKFATKWKLEHWTSSPWYLQSNVKAENVVKTCKGLLRKATENKKRSLNGNSRLAKYPKRGIWHLTRWKADGSTHSHATADFREVS